VVPTFGSTGAIEAIRNHIFRLVLKPRPVLLTVSPGYWRARESFQGAGFKIESIETINSGFNINEAALMQRAAELQPEAVYLSLPNNPTGAVFDAAAVVAGVPERTAVILDLTLPASRLDSRELSTHLYRRFQGRSKLFLIGSTSKSHGTAEYRIGWAICACSEDAVFLRKENRNVVSSVAVEKAVSRLYQESQVKAFIEKSFYLLRGAAGETFELIEPAKRVESSYVLIRLCGDQAAVRNALEQHRIEVMWGSEFGLMDRFVRLEVSEPENVREFISALACTLEKKQMA
jgi:histidinol-phosphate aminotransferase